MVEDPHVKAARLFLRDVAGRATVGLIYDAPGEEPLDWGSGTLFRTSNGRVVVLTAKHVISNRGPAQLLAESSPLPDAVEAYLGGPQGVDVGLAVLRPDVAKQVVDFALGSEVLGEPADVISLPRENPVMVMGFSKQLKGEVVVFGARRVRMGLLVYRSQNVGSDNRALSIEFRSGVGLGTINFGEGVGIAEGVEMGLKKPDGLSGGAVYGIARVPKTQVLCAESALRVIGVAHEFANGRQRAVHLAQWRDWFVDQLQLI